MLKFWSVCVNIYPLSVLIFPLGSNISRLQLLPIVEVDVEVVVVVVVVVVEVVEEGESSSHFPGPELAVVYCSVGWSSSVRRKQ